MHKIMALIVIEILIAVSFQLDISYKSLSFESETA